MFNTMDKIRDKLEPYKRYIMIGGFTMLILLVVYLGYARGSLDVCNDLGGRLEVGWDIHCQPGHYDTPPAQEGVDAVGQRFVIPDIIIENDN